MFWTYEYTLFEKSFLPTGSVNMFRHLSLTVFGIDYKENCP